MNPAREVAADSVASPCVSICKLDAAGRYCIGCFRTLDEIADWAALGAAAKREVLAALPSRRAALEAKESPR